MPFLTPLDVRNEGPRQWRLLAPLVYAGKRERFEIPAGFVTDFASVPRAIWWLPGMSPSDDIKASVLHDYLYATKAVSRRDGDGLYRRVMREERAPAPARWAKWAALRLFGWAHY